MKKQRVEQATTTSRGPLKSSVVRHRAADHGLRSSRTHECNKISEYRVGFTLQDSGHTCISQQNLDPFCIMIGQLSWGKADLIRALKYLVAMLNRATEITSEPPL